MSKRLNVNVGDDLAAIQKKLKTPPTTSVNIQITLPVTENGKVHEGFFKALKENLLHKEPTK